VLARPVAEDGARPGAMRACLTSCITFALDGGDDDGAARLAGQVEALSGGASRSLTTADVDDLLLTTAVDKFCLLGVSRAGNFRAPPSCLPLAKRAKRAAMVTVLPLMVLSMLQAHGQVESSSGAPGQVDSSGAPGLVACAAAFHGVLGPVAGHASSTDDAFYDGASGHVEHGAVCGAPVAFYVGAPGLVEHAFYCGAREARVLYGDGAYCGASDVGASSDGGCAAADVALDCAAADGGAAGRAGCGASAAVAVDELEAASLSLTVAPNYECVVMKPHLVLTGTLLEPRAFGDAVRAENSFVGGHCAETGVLCDAAAGPGAAAPGLASSGALAACALHDGADDQVDLSSGATGQVEVVLYDGARCGASDAGASQSCCGASSVGACSDGLTTAGQVDFLSCGASDDGALCGAADDLHGGALAACALYEGAADVDAGFLGGNGACAACALYDGAADVDAGALGGYAAVRASGGALCEGTPGLPAAISSGAPGGSDDGAHCGASDAGASRSYCGASDVGACSDGLTTAGVEELLLTISVDDFLTIGGVSRGHFSRTPLLPPIGEASEASSDIYCTAATVAIYAAVSCGAPGQVETASSGAPGQVDLLPCGVSDDGAYCAAADVGAYCGASDDGAYCGAASGASDDGAYCGAADALVDAAPKCGGAAHGPKDLR
jgi:hypothetical protein